MKWFDFLFLVKIFALICATQSMNWIANKQFSWLFLFMSLKTSSKIEWQSEFKSSFICRLFIGVIIWYEVLKTIDKTSRRSSSVDRRKRINCAQYVCKLRKFG